MGFNSSLIKRINYKHFTIYIVLRTPNYASTFFTCFLSHPYTSLFVRIQGTAFLAPDR